MTRDNNTSHSKKGTFMRGTKSPPDKRKGYGSKEDRNTANKNNGVTKKLFSLKKKCLARGTVCKCMETNAGFKGPIPTFDTAIDARKWIYENIKGYSNPSTSGQEHCITHVMDFPALLRMTRTNSLHVCAKPQQRENSPIIPSKLDSSTDPVIVHPEPYMNYDWDSVHNTLSYMFFHIRGGILVTIRNGIVSGFVPFVNKQYNNSWCSLSGIDVIKAEDIIVAECNSTDDTIDNYHVNPGRWWLDGSVICNRKCLSDKGIDQHQLDTGLLAMRHMLDSLCESADIPDTEFIINRNNIPVLHSKYLDPNISTFADSVPGIPDSFVKPGFIPIMSPCTSEKYADIVFPSSVDWSIALGKVLPDSSIKHKGKYKLPSENHMALIDPTLFVPWDQKDDTLFFRGSVSGPSFMPCTPCTRATIVDGLCDKWKESDTKVLLDVGITRSSRKKRFNCDWSIHEDNLVTSTTNTKGYVPYSKWNKYKYILDIDGETGTDRMPILLSLGCVIIKVYSHGAGNITWCSSHMSGYDLNAPYTEPTESYLKSIKYDHIIVPGGTDMIIKTIEWCENNPEICRVIAENARNLYMTLYRRESVLGYLHKAIMRTHELRCSDPNKWSNPTFVDSLEDTVKQDNKLVDPDKRSNVVVIIPYMNNPNDNIREGQLSAVVPAIRYLLTKCNTVDNFHIIVAEQTFDGKKFNLGRLANATFNSIGDLSLPWEPTHVIFHCVDLLPSTMLSDDYGKVPNAPYCIGAACGRQPSSKGLLGGVLSVTPDDFRSVDGYPTFYWGWGGEDDELHRRFKSKGITPTYIRKNAYGTNTLIDLEQMDWVAKNASLAKGNMKCKSRNVLREMYNHCRTTGQTTPWWGLDIKDKPFTTRQGPTDNSTIMTFVFREQYPEKIILRTGDHATVDYITLILTQESQ